MPSLQLSDGYVVYNTHCKIRQKVKNYNLAISVSLIEFKLAEDI